MCASGRVAQWESARFTRERSQVRNPPRPPWRRADREAAHGDPLPGIHRRARWTWNGWPVGDLVLDHTPFPGSPKRCRSCSCTDCGRAPGLWERWLPVAAADGWDIWAVEGARAERQPSRSSLGPGSRSSDLVTDVRDHSRRRRRRSDQSLDGWARRAGGGRVRSARSRRAFLPAVPPRDRGSDRSLVAASGRVPARDGTKPDVRTAPEADADHALFMNGWIGGTRRAVRPFHGGLRP